MNKIQTDSVVIKADKIYKKNIVYSKSNSIYDLPAIFSGIIGVIGICPSFMFGLCCFPIPLISIVLGVIGIRSESYKVFAYIGIIISIFSIIISICLLGFGLLVNFALYDTY